MGSSSIRPGGQPLQDFERRTKFFDVSHELLCFVGEIGSRQKATMRASESVFNGGDNLSGFLARRSLFVEKLGERIARLT